MLVYLDNALDNVYIGGTKVDKLCLQDDVVFTGQDPKTILYTSTTGDVIAPKVSTGYPGSLVSNEYVDGQGIMTFTEDVTTIPASAFADVKTIVSVSMPSSVTSVGKNAFQNCSALENTNWPSAVKSVPDACYQSCHLSSFPFNGIETIGVNSFSGNVFTEISLPDSVKEAKNSCFQNNKSLEHIRISNSMEYLEQFVYNCIKLKELVIPDNITRLVRQPFQQCSSLTSVDFGHGLQNITPASFQSCTSLTSLYIPRNVVQVDGQAFQQCSKLNTIIFEDASTLTLLAGATGSQNGWGHWLNKTAVSVLRVPGLVVDLNISASTAFTRDTLIDLMNDLGEVSGKQLVMGSTNLNKLTEEDKAIAVNKGWVLS